jgi:diguanylate cyclase (GGDEF)-like protein/PAS domain S-box-containing protein
MLDEPAVGGIVINVRDVSEREEALDELRRSEAKFRSLFEHANDVGFLTDVTGRIRYVTPSLHDVLGYRPEDVVGKGTWDTLGIDVNETSVSEIVTALAAPGSRVDFTATLRAADGASRWVEITVRNLTDDPAVEGFVTNLRDVTDRMETLVALRTSEARQRAIVARSNELTIFFAGDGTVQWVSPAAAEIFDVVPEALVGSNGFDMIHPEDRERVLAEFLTMTGVGDHVRTQYRTVDFTGRVRWIDEVVTNLIDDPDVGYVVGNLRDITDQHLAADALAASEARYRSIVETAQEGIWVTGLDGSTVFANATMARMLGTEVETLERHPLTHFLAPGPRRAIDASAWHEALFRRDDGSDLWAIVNTSPLYDGVGDVTGDLHMVTDINERKKMERELSHLALHDRLTGLPNRTLFVNRLEHCLLRGAERPTAVVYLDLDHFKDINESFGHDAGDDVLVAIGTRLRTAARSADTVARFSGDEFVVLNEDVADASDAVALAEILHTALRRPLRVGALEVMVSASIGVALAPPDDAVSVLDSASAAMYRAKKQGRARIALSDQVPNQAAQAQLRTQIELHRALEHDELVVWYQPIVSLQQGSVVGVEALVRWQHPQRGIILPAEFIPVAEASGLIRDLGWRVLEISTRDASTWFSEQNQVRLSINLAAAQLADDDLLERVQDALTAVGLPPESLTMELTESAAMHDEEASVRQLRGLCELGVHLALDDFGTGYSSLSLLRRLPIRAVKIDRSFVEGLGVNRDDTLLVGGVISMARAMGHLVIAEGIETEAQREEVTRLGCNYGQGYLFSPAVPLDQLGDVIADINASFGPAAAGVTRSGMMAANGMEPTP